MIVFHSYVNVYQRVFQLQAEVSLQLHLKKLSQCWKPGGGEDDAWTNSRSNPFSDFDWQTPNGQFCIKLSNLKELDFVGI